MFPSDLSNYTPFYGRGGQLRRELVEFVRYFDTHPNSVNDAIAAFTADSAEILAALNAAKPSVPVTSVAIAPKTASVEVGKTTKLTPTVAPANATNKKVTYASSDASKATVAADGTVTGVAAGSATITATTDDGAKKDTSVITVTAPAG